MRLSRYGSMVLVAGAGLVLGVGASVAATGSPGASADQRPVQSVQTHQFPRNASGLTFGSELDAATPADAPDLIQAYASNGKLGYVKGSDLVLASPTSPQAALKAQEAAKSRVITVYSEDGRTPIGVFEIAPPTEVVPETAP